MRKIYQTVYLLPLLLLLLGLSSTPVWGQFYNFDGLSVGDVGTLSNGWVGSPTTNFSWRADNNGTGSGGTGPDVDHTLGTAAGIYMYTEASTPAAPGDTAFLESPNLNLATFNAPALSFWYHKAGGSMGDLYVDIFNGTTYIRDVDSIIGATQNATSDPWLERRVNLTAFTGTIRVRFRAVCGAGFAGDMAIDDVSLVELPAQDVEIADEVLLPVRYAQYPLPQSTNISFGATLTNIGAQTATNAKLRVTVGAWSDSAQVASLAAGASANLTTGTLPPQPLGDYTALFESSITEPDSNQANNNATANFSISDSIYARDDSVATGALGIGPGTAGILGQNFDVYVTDTITTVSFFLNGPSQGDTTFVSLHPFTTQPGAEIARTDTLFVPVAGPGWYTLNFPCPQILTPGTYFLGVHEFDPNVTLGTTSFNYQPNTTWIIFGTNPWNTSESYGFPVTFLLRANFGRYTPEANAGMGSTDSTCANAGMFDLGTALSGGDPGGTWVDAGATGGLSGTMVDPSVTGAGTFTFTYGVIDACGYTDSTDVTLVIAAAPNPGVDSTIMVCDFDAAFDLTPFLGTADAGGTWNDDDNSGALTGTNFDPNVAGPGTFNFTYTVSAPDCADESATVTVSVMICPAIDPAIPLSFSIVPNPNHGIFRLEAPGSVGQELEVRIIDLTGRAVYEHTLYNASGTLEVDLNHVSRGLYIVELNNGESSTQGRLIKE
ncbi:MAG: T9SS type A sorting domain-containing protein [Bacteroidota bacterium]